VLFILAGCSGPRLEIAEVDGKITLNNKPLGGVIITFYPLSEGNEQWPYSTAISSSDGSFTLTFQNAKPGAVFGPHRAVVQWPSRDRLEGRGERIPAGTPIPLRYTTILESPLAIEIKAGGRQTVELKLED
jgi:hypothetical protein